MNKRWGRKPTVEPRRAGDAARNASPPANQYYRSRTISSYTPTPEPEHARHSIHSLHSHRRRLLRVLIGCVVAILVLGFLISQFTATIKVISYSPAVLTTPDETKIRTTVNDYYASRPLERFRFLLNEKNLSSYLISKIPEVQDVQSVRIEGLGSSSLALDMRTPVASWNTNETVYVDSSGASFTHNYYAAPSVVVEDQSGASASGSTSIASGSMIRYIGQLIAALKDNGSGTVSKVVLPPGMIRELDVYLEGRAYRIKVQLDRGVVGQAADVKSAITFVDSHGGAKEYIDVRVPGKAYYK